MDGGLHRCIRPLLAPPRRFGRSEAEVAQVLCTAAQARAGKAGHAGVPAHARLLLLRRGLLVHRLLLGVVWLATGLVGLLGRRGVVTALLAGGRAALRGVVAALGLPTVLRPVLGPAAVVILGRHVERVSKAVVGCRGGLSVFWAP